MLTEPTPYGVGVSRSSSSTSISRASVRTASRPAVGQAAEPTHSVLQGLSRSSVPSEARSELDGEAVVSGIEVGLIGSGEHVRGQVGEHDPAAGQVVPVRGEIGVAKVMGDGLVEVVGLGDEQVCASGDSHQMLGPGSVTGVSDNLAANA